MLLRKVIKQQIFTAKKESVIDLGSNSIRMLIYEEFNKSQIPIFNEKAVCSLGNNLEINGKLDPLGVQYSLKVLERFKNILDNSKVTNVHLFATAAVRDAKDGSEFKATVEKIFNCEVEVLTGEQEAERSALGVHQNHSNAFFFQNPASLSSRIVELTCLANHNRPASDN